MNTENHERADEWQEMKAALLGQRQVIERQHQIYFKSAGCGSLDLEFRGRRIEFAYEIFYAIRKDYRDHVAQRVGFWLVPQDMSQEVYAALEAREAQRLQEAAFYAEYYDAPRTEFGLLGPVRILHYDHANRCYRYHDTKEIHWQIIAD